MIEFCFSSLCKDEIVEPEQIEHLVKNLVQVLKNMDSVF